MMHDARLKMCQSHTELANNEQAWGNLPAYLDQAHAHASRSPSMVSCRFRPVSNQLDRHSKTKETVLSLLGTDTNARTFLIV